MTQIFQRFLIFTINVAFVSISIRAPTSEVAFISRSVTSNVAVVKLIFIFILIFVIVRFRAAFPLRCQTTDVTMQYSTLHYD